MKDYYFTRKPEVVEASDYEKEGGYTRYYYKKGEWKDQRRTTKKRFVSGNLKKQRRVIYGFSILIIIFLFVIWKSTDEKSITSYYDKKDNLIYFIKLGGKSNNHIILYIRNALDKENLVSKEFTIEFFYIRGKDKVLIEEVTKSFEITLKANANTSIIEYKLKEEEEEENIPKNNGLGVIIDKKIILQKVY